MSKHRTDIIYGHSIPQDMLDALQEFISTYASPNFLISIVNPTTLRVAAGTVNAQVCIGINGKWRYNTANADAALPGGLPDGDHPIFVAASDNAFSGGGGGTNETDSTDYTFRLLVLLTGTTPTGTGTQALYRQVGLATVKSGAITSVTQSIGAAGGTPAAPVGTMNAGQGLGLRTVQGVVPGKGAGDVQTDPNLALKVSAPGGSWVLTVQPGYALVQGTDTAQQAMYDAVVAVATSVTMATHNPATNPRVDAIIARYNDPAIVGRTPTGLSLEQAVGTATAGATLANLTGAPGKAGGPALPTSCIVLAYVLVLTTDTTGPQAANVQQATKLAGPGIWGEDGHRYRLGVDASGILGLEQVF